MMKGFVTCGKMMALALMAAGLLFAGCAQQDDGSGSSSATTVEGMVNVDGQTSFSLFPMSLDPANKVLTMGDGSGTALVGAINGYTIELRNGDSTTPLCMSDGAGSAKCWIRLTNLAKDVYLANAFVWATQKTAVSTGSNWFYDNVDVTTDAWQCDIDTSNSDTFTLTGCVTTASGNVTGTGSAGAINGGGFCYASDTWENSVQAYNKFNCPTVLLPTQQKPKFMIHAGCGMVSQAWDWGGDPDLFTFEVAVTAETYPQNPYSGDTRFDFQDRVTSLVMVQNMVDLASGNQALARYRLGSSKRSETIAGFGAPGSISYANVVPGQVIGVDVGMEYPDRIESNMGVGDKSQFDPVTGYTYYWSTATLLTFNPDVLEANTISAAVTTPSGTTYYGGLKDVCVRNASDTAEYSSKCVVPDATGNGSTSWHPLKVDPLTIDFGYGLSRPTYVAVSNDVAEANVFNYLGTATPLYGSEYFTTGLGGVYAVPIWVKAANQLPKDFGHYGVVDIIGKGTAVSNLPYLYSWYILTKKGAKIYNYTYYRKATNASTALSHQGVDPNPEVILWNLPFKVKAGTTGKSSPLIIDTYSGFTKFSLGHTLNTFSPSGSGTADFTSFCLPKTGGDATFWCNYSVMPAVDHLVAGGFENPPQSIYHRGPSKLGMFQAWNVGICVQ